MDRWLNIHSCFGQIRWTTVEYSVNDGQAQVDRWLNIQSCCGWLGRPHHNIQLTMAQHRQIHDWIFGPIVVRLAGLLTSLSIFISVSTWDLPSHLNICTSFSSSNNLYFWIFIKQSTRQFQLYSIFSILQAKCNLHLYQYSLVVHLWPAISIFAPDSANLIFFTFEYLLSYPPEWSNASLYSVFFWLSIIYSLLNIHWFVQLWSTIPS